MEGVFTVLGYLCCIFITGYMVSILANFFRHLINGYCFKNDEYTIRDYKEDINEILYDAKESGYKIMFRDIHCEAYENYNIHIAKQDGEDIIVIDLF
jgi:hypothetical protein